MAVSSRSAAMSQEHSWSLPCHWGGLRLMNCKSRAEAFARSLHSKLWSLGRSNATGNDDDDVDADITDDLEMPPPPPVCGRCDTGFGERDRLLPVVVAEPNLMRMNGDDFLELVVVEEIDSPGSPADESIAVVNRFDDLNQHDRHTSLIKRHQCESETPLEAVHRDDEDDEIGTPGNALEICMPYFDRKSREFHVTDGSLQVQRIGIFQDDRPINGDGDGDVLDEGHIELLCNGIRLKPPDVNGALAKCRASSLDEKNNNVNATIERDKVSPDTHIDHSKLNGSICSSPDEFEEECNLEKEDGVEYFEIDAADELHGVVPVPNSETEPQPLLSNNDESFNVAAESQELTRNGEELDMHDEVDSQWVPVVICSEEGSAVAPRDEPLPVDAFTQTVGSLDVTSLLPPHEDATSDIDARLSCFNLESPEEKPQRVQRCSSLKTGKTPPGTPSLKKIVRFADALGLDLEAVKTVFLDDLPVVPSSAFSDLQDVGSASSSITSSLTDMMPFDIDDDERTRSFFIDSSQCSLQYPKTVPSPSLHPGITLVPVFSQPASQPDFLDRLSRQKVCLENAVATETTVHAVVRVLNISFRKEVKVRFSRDGWYTSRDLSATYVQGSCDGFSDKFTFVLYADGLNVGERLSFAICYRVLDQEHWDSNHGQNYNFQCFPEKTPMMSPPEEESWLRFL